MIMIKKSDDFLRIYKKTSKFIIYVKRFPGLPNTPVRKQGNSGPNFQRILINFRKKIEKQKIENSREYFEPSAHEPSFDVAQVFYNFPRREKNDTDSKPFVKKSDFNDST